MHKRRIVVLVSAVLMGLIIGVGLLRSMPQKMEESTWLFMDTQVTVSVDAKFKEFLPYIRKEMQELADRLNYYGTPKTSCVAKFNSGYGLQSADRCYPLLKRLIVMSKGIYIASNGLFNPVFRSKAPLEGIRITDAYIANPKGLVLDLSAIAKGYIVDQAVGRLRAIGSRAGIVNAGGDLAVFGLRFFRVGIRDPYSKDGIIDKVYLSNGALATSGQYERPGHIVDWKEAGDDGRQKVLSATVAAPSCAAADGWATALFLMGRPGLNVLEREGLPALVVYEENGKARIAKNRLWKRFLRF